MQKNKKARWILSVILVVIIGTSIWGYDFYRDINSPEEVFQGPSEEELQAQKEAQQIDEEVQENFEVKKTNILLLGMDRTEKRDEIYRLYRPDAIVLATIDFNSGEVDLTSFPRDTDLWIAHRPGKDKVNASFYYGHDLGNGKTPEERREEGFRYTVDTISEFLGDVPIDYYVSLDMDGVIEIVDALGGVEMNVDISFEEAVPGVGRSKIQEGVQRLDGLDFVNYVRYREHKAEKDEERAGRQQQALEALLQELKGSNKLKTLPKIYQTMTERVDTNLNLKQISALALFAGKIEPENIEKHMVEGEYEYRDKIPYYIPDEQKRKELVKEVFEIELVTQR